MSSAYERRDFSMDAFKIQKKTKTAPGRIVGHAAVFDKPFPMGGGAFNEIMRRGAFQQSIAESDDVRALFNHNPDHVLGRTRSGTLTLKEDEQGLWTEIIPPDTQFANDLMKLVDRGDITQMSIGFFFRPGGEEWTRDPTGQELRIVTACKLFDISAVTYPACPDTDLALRTVNHGRPPRTMTEEERIRFLYHRSVELGGL